MKYFSPNSIVFIIILFSISPTLKGQQVDKQESYYNWFDQQVGIENTGLYNGIRYKELYRVKNGKHKFYKSPNFIKANIIYQNESYYDVELKYDLYEDQVIINLRTKSGNSIFQLIKEFVESFTIDNKKFVNLPEHKVRNSSNAILGFYEITFTSSNLTLYKKHTKFRMKSYNKNNVLSAFKNKDMHYMQHNENFYLINSKYDVIKAFPKYKKEINTFYNQNKILLKSNFDMFLIQLSKQLSSLNLKKIN